MGGLWLPGEADRRARALLLECLLAVAEDRPKLAAWAAGPVPGRRLLELARAAGLEETAAHALLSAHAPLDAGTREALEDAYQNGTAKNALLLRDASEILEALREAGVDAVALKGVAMIGAHYPAIGARHVGDLDLLVRARDREDARAVLARLGMQQARPEAEAPPPGTVHGSPYLTRGGFACELHLRLPGETMWDDRSVEGVFARSRWVTWQGRALRIPSPPDLAGIASVHALDHHRGDGRFRARLVADLAVLAATGADLAGAEQHYGGAVGAALRLLAAARAGRPEAALPRLLGSPIGGVVRRAAVTWVALRRAIRRGQVTAFLFPDRAFLAQRYGVSVSSPLLPLLYLYRPLGSLIRLLTGR